MSAKPLDLATFYALAVGTLLVSAIMTWWERSSRPDRRGSLGLFTAAYLMLAIGCITSMARTVWPGALSSALASLIILGGYLLILEGVASLGGRSYRGIAVTLLAIVGLGWACGGTRWLLATWSYACALPVALACGLTAWEAWRSPALRPYRSRHLVASISGSHALLYLVRGLVLPMVVARGGPGMLVVAGRITLYEGVLYSVCLPMAVLAVCREETHMRLIREAKTDHLTGLGNRAWFFAEAERLIAARRSQVRFALLAFDLDRFKVINDCFGHATGDEVLRVFAATARSWLPDGTILARIGGEEFVALIAADGRAARTIAQSVAQRFAGAIVVAGDGSTLQATVSIGVAELVEGSDLSALLSSADRALYVAKALGRNRIEMADPERLKAIA